MFGGDIASRLAVAHHAVQEMIAAHVKAHHIDYHDARILVAVSMGVTSYSGLKRSSLLDRGAFTNLSYRLDKLHKRGYLLDKSDPADRRIKVRHLSEAGAMLVRQAAAPVMENIDREAGPFFTLKQLDQLLEQLKGISSAPAPKLHVVGSGKR